MFKALQWGISIVALAALGCGGDGDGSSGGSSGVSGSKRIDQLTASEIADICEWAIDQFPTSVTCEGVTVEISDSLRATARSSCESEAQEIDNCDVTVSQVEACLEAEADNFCGDEDPPECAALDACDV